MSIFSEQEVTAMVGLGVTFSVRAFEIFAQSYPGQKYTLEQLAKHERCEHLFVVGEKLGDGTRKMMHVVLQVMVTLTDVFREIKIEGDTIYEVVKPDGRFSTLAPVSKEETGLALQGRDG